MALRNIDRFKTFPISKQRYIPHESVLFRVRDLFAHVGKEQKAEGHSAFRGRLRLYTQQGLKTRRHGSLPRKDSFLDITDDLRDILWIRKHLPIRGHRLLLQGTNRPLQFGGIDFVATYRDGG